MSLACFGCGRVGQCDARRGGDTVLLGHATCTRTFLVGPFPCQIGHLQSKAEGGKAFHENLALIGRDGGDVDRSLGKDEGKGLVGIGRFALLSQYGRSRVHGILWVGTPGVSYFQTLGQVQLGRASVAGGLSFRGFPTERTSVGVNVQNAQAGLAPPRSSVLDDGDARP